MEDLRVLDAKYCHPKMRIYSDLSPEFWMTNGNEKFSFVILIFG